MPYKNQKRWSSCHRMEKVFADFIISFQVITRSSLVVDVLEVLGLGVLPDDHFGHVGEELDKLQEVHLAVVIVVEEVDDLLDAVVVQVEAQTLEQGSQLGHLDVGIAVAVDEEKGIEELVSRDAYIEMTEL